MKNLKNCFKTNTFKRRIIFDALYKISIGIFMGISDGIPGYSGGTTLSLFSFYDVLMNKIKLLFKKNKISIWMLNLLSLFPFFIFWILFLILFSLFSSFISNKGVNGQIILFFLFFSFSLFCIPTFALKNLSLHWQKFKLIKTTTKLIYFFIFFIFFLLMVSIGIVLYFNGGISLEKQNIGNMIQFNVYTLFILFTCFLSGFCMLIPGISGSLILFLSKTYDDIYWIALQNPIENIGFLCLVVIFIFLGILTSVFTINFLIKKYYFFKFISLGLIIGSPIAMILSFLGNPIYLNSLPIMFSSWNNYILFFLLVVFVSVIINLIFILFFIIKIRRINMQFNFLNINKNSALIVVDMQNDFYINGSLEVKESDQIIDYVNEVISYFQINNLKIIFSQDYHPQNHCSFSTWPKHCIQNHYGSEFIPIVNKESADLIIRKGTNIDIDNYSAFYNGHTESELKTFLVENKISDLYILGLAGDYCVKQTSLDALNFGFNVYLLEKGIKSVDSNFELSSIDKRIKIIH